MQQAPSTETSFCAASIAACALVCVSPTTRLIGPPKTPPASLTSFTASFMPSKDASP